MRLLLTTFGAYEEWTTNASQLAVERLDIDRIPAAVVVREYPVEFSGARAEVLKDHHTDYDVVVHVGQSKRASQIELEMVAVNFGRESDDAPHFLLEPHGPTAYACRVDYRRVAAHLTAAQIPCEISFHAGVYICNAVLYWSHFVTAERACPPRIAFVHLPLEPAQRQNATPGGSLPQEQSAQALELIIEDLLAGQAIA